MCRDLFGGKVNDNNNAVPFSFREGRGMLLLFFFFARLTGAKSSLLNGSRPSYILDDTSQDPY